MEGREEEGWRWMDSGLREKRCEMNRDGHGMGEYGASLLSLSMV